MKKSSVVKEVRLKDPHPRSALFSVFIESRTLICRFGICRPIRWTMKTGGVSLNSLSSLVLRRSAFTVMVAVMRTRTSLTRAYETQSDLYLPPASGQWESNPCLNLGKVPWYHYTMAAYNSLVGEIRTHGLWLPTPARYQPSLRLDEVREFGFEPRIHAPKACVFPGYTIPCCYSLVGEI